MRSTTKGWWRAGSGFALGILLCGCSGPGDDAEDGAARVASAEEDDAPAGAAAPSDGADPAEPTEAEPSDSGDTPARAPEPSDSAPEPESDAAKPPSAEPTESAMATGGTGGRDAPTGGVGGQSGGGTPAPRTTGGSGGADPQAAGGTAGGASGSGGDGTALEPLSFAQIEQEVFEPAGCGAGYCHGGGAGDMVWSYESLVSMAAAEPVCGLTVRVVPGDPEASILWARVNPIASEAGEDCGEPMPKDAPPLDAEQAQLVYDWIATGAAP